MIHFHYVQPERNSSSTHFPIHLVQQFYVDSHRDRHEENVFCLQKNVDNPHIQSIFLLNEREYTNTELGVNDPLKKIKQSILGTRLLYSDVFSFVSRSAIEGYIVFANTDIFLDETIAHLRYTNLHSKKHMYALLRYEYDPNSRKSQLFGPRYDSQDTWIFHSSQNIKPSQEKGLRFAFGKPGCDNKFVYIASALGYTLFNDPLAIKTHHYHTSRLRNYSFSDRLGPPYSMLIPHGIPLTRISASFGLLSTADIGKWSIFWSRFSWEKDNRTLKHWIETNRTQQTKYAVTPHLLRDTLLVCDVPQDFNNTEKSRSSSYFQHIVTNVPKDNLVIGKTAMEAYHFIHFEPWTLALKGTHLLIAIFESKKVANLLCEKWAIREQIYGRDFFPECTADIVFMETPDQPLDKPYDAMVTDGGVAFTTKYVNQGKSVIVFEPFVLQLLFGMFTMSSMKMRPDILRMYMNQYWTKIE